VKDYKEPGSELKDITRRHFIGDVTTGLGGIALSSLFGCSFGGSNKNDSLISAAMGTSPSPT
jgi:hypothetical protein